MRKLLAVAALLAVGATSFAAVTKEVEQKKGHTSVALPVGVRGNIVAPENLMLEVHAVKSAGVNGDRFEFDFGNLVLGSTVQTLEGTFEARLLTATYDKGQAAPDYADRKRTGIKEVKFAAAPVYTLDDRAVAFDDAAKYTTPVKTIKNTAEQQKTVKGVALDYTLNSTKGLVGETVNKGTLVVTADAKGATETGVFTTADIDLRVVIQNQDAGIDRTQATETDKPAGAEVF